MKKMSLKNLGANQTEVSDEQGETLFSYETPVARYQAKGDFVLGDDWDYSKTTVKHVTQWTGQSAKELRDKIKAGEIQVITL